MDLDEIRKLMGVNGRVIIVEQGKPALVILGAQEFLGMQETLGLGSSNVRAGTERKNPLTSENSPDVPLSETSTNPSEVNLEELTLDELGVEDLGA